MLWREVRRRLGLLPQKPRDSRRASACGGGGRRRKRFLVKRGGTGGEAVDDGLGTGSLLAGANFGAVALKGSLCIQDARLLRRNVLLGRVQGLVQDGLDLQG